MTVGIYMISTPAGAKYIGSSANIEQRWREHRSGFRTGNHGNSRLLAAFRKYEDLLHFQIVEHCERSALAEREQSWIDRVKPRLNICKKVGTLPPSAYSGLARLRDTEEGRERLRQAYAAKALKRSIPVESEDGRRWVSYSAAARDLGLYPSAVKILVEGQHRRPCGLRLKRQSDEWTAELSYGKRAALTRRKNGTDRHTAESRLKMSLRMRGQLPPRKAVENALKVNCKPVRAKRRADGVTQVFPSARHAVRALGLPDRNSAQICKAIKGVKRSAYGYEWGYA